MITLVLVLRWLIFYRSICNKLTNHKLLATLFHKEPQGNGGMTVNAEYKLVSLFQTWLMVFLVSSFSDAVKSCSCFPNQIKIESQQD